MSAGGEGDEIACEARPESLDPIFAFLDRHCAGVTDLQAAFAMRLAAEEVCANVIAHGYPGGEPGPIRIRFEHRPGALAVTVEDRGIPFDPADAPPPPIEEPWDVRPIGGVGWYLVRRMVDEVHHEALPGGGNRVTLIKRLADQPAGTPEIDT